VAFDNSQSNEIDLDRTDRLPILEGVLFDHEAEDDAAVRPDSPAAQPAAPLKGQIAHSDFARSPPVDLPSLAESVRSVEERIARQSAEYEALSRLYEKAHAAEAAAVARANAAAADLATAQSTLVAEQHRSRELDRALGEKSALAEATRTRVEEALGETERSQSEARTLRESLATRDATVVQILNSLRERDAQLNALQREHAKIVPELETRSSSNVQLAAEVQALQARSTALGLELKTSHESTSVLTARVELSESELRSARSELGELKSQAATYLEQLRSREWRLGFDQNMFREMDAEVGAAQAGRDSLQEERDQLRRQLADLESKLSIRDATIAELQRTLDTNAASHNTATQEIQRNERLRTDLSAQIETLNAERSRLRNELAARDCAVAEAQTTASAEVLRREGAIQESEKKQTELLLRIAQLQSEADEREQEMTVLMAHLQESRRPVQSIEAEVKRLADELASKTAAFDQVNEDARSLRATLERTRGALEEREFLIRRLERSESTNAAVLGRIQTSIERLGTAPASDRPLESPAAESAAEFIRLDGEHEFRHALGRRTRIGRAPGCELQIDSSSVSRHHALILVGPHESIIEDLNSTNGVIVNGRIISRQTLRDGDLVTIGDVKFRFAVKQALPLRRKDPPKRPPAG
jgi:chromosome segregation ATPase